MSIKKNARRIQVKKNIAITVLYQLTSLVIGLILPRWVLKTYGSEVNGVVQSISQFLSYTVILECGIGGMALAAFYKPLAYGDSEAVSDIFNNTKKFFTKISLVFLALVAVLAFSTRFIIKTDFSPLYIGSLVLILGINNYFVYYFGLTHQLLMKADQKLYIVQSVQIFALILNAAACIAAMEMGFGIHFVRLISMFVFLINPLAYRYYVKKHYAIGKEIYDSSRGLPQKRDGMVHHVAYFIHRNTDIVLLTVFKGVKTVSVYSVYYAIMFAAENFLNAISSGLAAAIGNILAKDEKSVLDKSFDVYEAVNTFITSFFCTASAVLIVPFVTIYTKGINDANYIQPVFAYILVLAQWFYCIRIPYGNVITAAGHYRETKPGAYLELFINLIISLAAVGRFGLSGVMAGTLTAMLARTLYTAWYLSKNILNRKIQLFVKNTGLHLAAGVLFVLAADKLYAVSTESPLLWVRDAIIVCAALFAVLAALNLIINRKIIKSVLLLLKEKPLYNSDKTAM